MGDCATEKFQPWLDGIYKLQMQGKDIGTIIITGTNGFFEGMGIKKEDEERSKMTIEFGDFEADDKRGLKDSDLSSYSVKMVWHGQSRTFFGNISPDRKMWTLASGDTLKLMDDEEVRKMEAGFEHFSNYNHSYPLQPDNQGKILWITGGTGMGKSTTSEVLREKHNFVYYEGDAFMFECNPYPGCSEKGTSVWGTKLLKDVPESRARITKICVKSYLELLKGNESPLENFNNFYDLLCDDILKEKSKIGGNWVVCQSVYLRQVRDFIRSKLGPQCIFVLLNMDEELQIKRLAKRSLGENGELTEEVIEKTRQSLKENNRSKGYQPMQDGEPNAIGIDIVESNTTDDIIEMIFSKISKV